VRPFSVGKSGEGEAAPQRQRRTTQRRVPQRPGRPKATVGVWRLKMTKGNWVDGSNTRLGRTADWAGENNMSEHEMF
jgi:hypothetical protein